MTSPHSNRTWRIFELPVSSGSWCLQADFRLRLLNWTLLRDHFARLWRGFYRRLARSAMFESSVNSFAHASCRLHVFKAWIERSMKSIFHAVLFVCCWDHIVVYTKTTSLPINGTKCCQREEDVRSVNAEQGCSRTELRIVVIWLLGLQNSISLHFQHSSSYLVHLEFSETTQNNYTMQSSALNSRFVFKTQLKAHWSLWLCDHRRKETFSRCSASERFLWLSTPWISCLLPLKRFLFSKTRPCKLCVVMRHYDVYNVTFHTGLHAVAEGSSLWTVRTVTS